MIKRTVVSLASVAALAGVAAPAFAASGLGFDPYYIENPRGREVTQPQAGAVAAPGFDPWYRPGRFDRAATQRSVARDGLQPESALPENVNRERYRQNERRAYSVPAFGPQANA